MAKFQMLVTEIVRQSALVEVEAETEEEAKTKAVLEVGLGDLSWSVTQHEVVAEVAS
jgi:hypothetical protein